MTEGSKGIVFPGCECLSACVCVGVYACQRTCVCVCMRERETERVDLVSLTVNGVLGLLALW